MATEEVKKFPAFSGTLNFILLSTRTRQLSLFSVSLIHSTTSIPFIYNMFLIPFHLCLDLPSDFFLPFSRIVTLLKLMHERFGAVLLCLKHIIGNVRVYIILISHASFIAFSTVMCHCTSCCPTNGCRKAYCTVVPEWQCFKASRQSEERIKLCLLWPHTS